MDLGCHDDAVSGMVLEVPQDQAAEIIKQSPSTTIPQGRGVHQAVALYHNTVRKRSPSSIRSLPQHLTDAEFIENSFSTTTPYGRGVHQAFVLYHNTVRTRGPLSSRSLPQHFTDAESIKQPLSTTTPHGRGVHQAVAVYHNISRTRSPSRSRRPHCLLQHLTVADCIEQLSSAAVAGHIAYYNTSQLQIASNNSRVPQSLVTLSTTTPHGCRLHRRALMSRSRWSQCLSTRCTLLVPSSTTEPALADGHGYSYYPHGRWGQDFRSSIICLKARNSEPIECSCAVLESCV